ncbi:hypothetical protein LJB82_03095 [Desulfovibrio sp. OttesenSCG-928-M16]|nr:hypothetical protein [Desulfovibrio sp. OttesenSCG-928-M16]
MLDRQTSPLEIASTVLKPETIREVRNGGYSNSGYLILDRWALNSPDELKRLEAQGEIAFDLKLYGQQQKEAQALSSESARQARLRGMSDWEILEMAGVDMSLKITE